MNERIPFRRLFAEFVVIFVGVFSAFSVDAWWDRTTERRDAEQLVAAVAAEFEYNVASLQRAMERHGRIAAAGLELLNVTGPAADSEAQSQALELIPRFYSEPTTDLRSGALSAALTSGAFETLGEQEAVSQLSRLPGFSAFFQEWEARIRLVMVEQIYPQLWLHIPQMNVEIATGLNGVGGEVGEAFAAGVPARSRFEPNVQDLLGDLVFENAVVERTTLLQWAEVYARNGIEAHEEGLALLRPILQ